MCVIKTHRRVFHGQGDIDLERGTFVMVPAGQQAAVVRVVSFEAAWLMPEQVTFSGWCFWNALHFVDLMSFIEACGGRWVQTRRGVSGPDRPGFLAFPNCGHHVILVGEEMDGVCLALDVSTASAGFVYTSHID